MTHRLTENTLLSEAGADMTAGRMAVQAISAGLGSSGLYRPEVLEQAARDRLITRGTPVHLDHASESERHDRPERSVQTIAGVFTGDATYDGTRQALVGEVQFFTPWRERIAEMAPYIGLSISGSATDVVEGEHEGRKVPVIEGLAAIDSVDLVTRAGRGGQILVDESARPSTALVEHINTMYGPALVEAGLVVTESDPATTYVPVRPGGNTPTEESKENTMPDTENARLRELEEAAGRVPTLESENASLKSEVTQLREAAAKRDRHDAARKVIAERAKAAGVTYREREIAGFLADLPLTESGDLDAEKLAETVDADAAELKEAAGEGRPHGFGTHLQFGEGGETVTESEFDNVVASAFGRPVKEA